MAITELPAEMEEHARTIHREAFLFDAALPAAGLYRDESAEIQAIVNGGINGANLATVEAGQNFQRTVDSINQLRKLVSRHSDRMCFCTTAEELELCKRDGKVGLVSHFQDAKPIEDSLDYLRNFYELGLRVFQLTYNTQGYVGSGCCERHDAGLSNFGLEVVAECNRLGILVDLSHCGHTTSWDAIKHSRAPVAFTHVGVYALCPGYGRNKPDDLLKAVADTGGVIGITFFPALVKRNPKTHEVLQADLGDILDAVGYAVNLVGVDHIGWGSDLANYFARTLEVPPVSSLRRQRTLRPDVFGAGRTDRLDPFPMGLQSHAEMMNFTRGLVQRGYKDEIIKKILGGNWLRLFRKVWRE